MSVEMLLIRAAFSLPTSFIFFIFGRGGMTLLSFGVCLLQLLANHNPSSRFSFEERFTNLSLLYKYLHLYLKEGEEKAPHGWSQPPHPLSPALPLFLLSCFRN